MKTLIKITLIAITIGGLLATSALAASAATLKKKYSDKKTSAARKDDKKAAAEKKKDEAKEENRTRALLVKVDKGEVDGLRVKILQSEGEAMVPVDAAKEFKSGDTIRVAFESNFDGFVYIVNVTPGGITKVLFPYKQEGDNMISKGQKYQLPGVGMIEFDKEVGTEVLQVYMSHERIKIFDDAVKNANGELGTSASSAAAELASRNAAPNAPSDHGGVTAENLTPVLPTEGEGAIRTRKIRLAPGKDQEKVAIPENNGAPVKMKNGEVAMFEIRLKHI
ncbi:MAG: DUF4384 domain-containing protein [Acidobacteria bacterium]|nr:DUF4384 domain-containing protein [Acidobacteriota bacterium]